MIVFLTLLGVACAAAAGVLLYRSGVEDGIRLCKTARRPSLTERETPAKREAEVDVAEQQRKLLQMVNFMQYDGSEMPKVKGGDER